LAEVVHSLDEMLAGLSPTLDSETYLFVTAFAGEVPNRSVDSAIGWFHEAEGVSMILPRDAALALGFADGSPMRRITLQVHSALEGVGLTAAVAGRLAEHGIGCNMVAAFHHDHLFVPADGAEEALAVLQQLEGEAR
jgi:hypothetical protein